MWIDRANLFVLPSGLYCLQCQSSAVKEKVDGENRIFYECPLCHHQDSRVLEIDPRIKLQKTREGWKHFTVGALIVDNFKEPSRYLIIKKRKHPYLYDVIAGHIERGERAEKALAREVGEEIGGIIQRKKLLLKIVINPDPCRRGINIHQWFLYLCSLKKDNIYPSKDEVADIRWYPKEALDDLHFVIPTEKMLKILKLIH